MEVFDSGSSCSLEDCWGCPDIPQAKSSGSGNNSTTTTTKSKKSKKTLASTITLAVADEASENEFDDLHVGSSMSASPYNPEPMESACPSETEEAISDDDEEEEEEDKMDGVYIFRILMLHIITFSQKNL